MTSKSNTVLMKFCLVLSRICEIGFWIAAVALAIVFIVEALLPQLMPVSVDSLLESTPLNVLGIEIESVSAHTLRPALLLLCSFGVIISTLYAMIFRNVSLIMKKLNLVRGQALSSENSPFQPDVIRMVREIGYFAIGIPLVTMIGQWLVSIPFRESSMSVSFSTIALALVVLTLSQIFSYGAGLQREVDDLV